ncbi:DUF1304 domain-containing protein [Demequina capsici]|uniref:DUF1304 domain-containing protein n=1 Tax=Demequina capsici TaxID=3075620 RepID=A0AA96F452_9MICO|nr:MULTISPECIES: DUF1304 domain-containing protein [unclassified Demequina]WNM23568.1 DUF1304 domain-containing protein [Demequina sp. OYTSA14]WNM26433.1 DUF1304 domain-containing protein [Demequina sp. PMTSA13]
MIPTALVLAALAALVHVYIFRLESLTWMAPRTRATFGVATEEEAEHTRLMAFNQGFYNLFLAIVTGVGIVLMGAGASDAGAALVLAGTGSMAAAAVVLVAKSPRLARSAAIQGALPLLSVVLLTLGLLA